MLWGWVIVVKWSFNPKFSSWSLVPAHFGWYFCVTIVDILSFSVRVRNLEVVLGFVRQRNSREPARKCDTSALWKSIAAQIEALVGTVSDRPVFVLDPKFSSSRRI